MLFVIHTVDRAGQGAVRAAHREAHFAYLQAHQSRLWASGGLFDEGADRARGGLIIIDFDNRQEADGFVANDPFTKADLFESVSVNGWKRSFQNGEFHPVPL